VERLVAFADPLSGASQMGMLVRLRAAKSIGRPLDDDRVLARIGRVTVRGLRAGKLGLKPKQLEKPTRRLSEATNSLATLGCAVIIDREFVEFVKQLSMEMALQASPSRIWCEWV
jgi:hypothetical protein